VQKLEKLHEEEQHKLGMKRRLWIPNYTHFRRIFFFATLNECIDWKKKALTKALKGLKEAYRNQREK
jgi:hypothetical protein